MPKYENELYNINLRQTFTIKGFLVEISFTYISNSLYGYVKKYTDNKEWIDMEKYNSIINSYNYEFQLEELEEIYIPYGGFTHQNGFDCNHASMGDISLY